MKISATPQTVQLLTGKYNRAVSAVGGWAEDLVCPGQSRRPGQVGIEQTLPSLSYITLPVGFVRY